MTYRILGGAEDDIDTILLDSAERWGLEAADRYGRLIGAVCAAVGAAPERLGSRAVARIPGVRVYALRLGRALVTKEQQVGRSRHLVVYRIGEDGVVEIMGLIHDRMLLDHAVRDRLRG